LIPWNRQGFLSSNNDHWVPSSHYYLTRVPVDILESVGRGPIDSLESTGLLIIVVIILELIIIVVIILEIIIIIVTLLEIIIIIVTLLELIIIIVTILEIIVTTILEIIFYSKSPRL
jgi:hypothetical protein